MDTVKGSKIDCDKLYRHMDTVKGCDNDKGLMTNCLLTSNDPSRGMREHYSHVWQCNAVHVRVLEW